MTNKDAIEDLEFMVAYDDFASLHKETIEMAISALQIEAQLEKNCKNCGNHDVPVVCSESCVDRCNWIPKKTEPCEDTISRQVAIKAIWDGINMDIYTREVKEILEELPSVYPKAKTGKWLVYTDCEGKTRQCVCDQCGYKTGKYTWKNPNFCENCGAKMAESEEE